MRFALWSTIVALIFAQVAMTGATPEASPVVTEGKPYLSHAARFVTTIPGDWVPDRSLAYDYAGESGFISSRSLDMPWNLPDRYLTLDETCDTVAEVYGGEQSAIIVAEMPACLVEPAADGNDLPVFVVITHPHPHGLQEFVMVTTNRGSLDRVLATLSFDLSGVAPELYLDAALDLISIRSLQRDLIDWDAIRVDAHRQLANVSPEEGFRVAHAVLQDVVAKIWATGGDGHNLFMSAEEVGGYSTYINNPSEATFPIVMLNEPAPGLVRIIVPRFSSTPEAGREFVAWLWDELDRTVDETTCGIVVDLTSNGGGIMDPMLQGLGPLIGTGPLLGFIDAAGNMVSVDLGDQFQVIRDGVASTVYTPDRPAPDFGDRSLPIAVYIGPMTASSGEATAIGMMASDHPVRFFGEPTYGLATSRGGIPLIDGPMVLLSDYWTTTIDGKTFPDGVIPDVEVDGWNMPGVAEEWIRETAGC